MWAMGACESCRKLLHRRPSNSDLETRDCKPTSGCAEHNPPFVESNKKLRPRQFKKKPARSSGLDLTGDPQSINLPQSSHKILPTSFFRFFSLVSRGAKDALKTKGSSVGSMKKMYLWFFFTLVHGASDPNSPTVTSCSRSRPPLLRGQTSSTLTFTRYGPADTFPGVDCTLPSITTADL